ncbi:MAG: NADPH:quinone reductase [Thermoanaerobaculia bacterium]|nr:NADPH:quinone reductase [Thermoanaerobaculia bacterium]
MQAICVHEFGGPEVLRLDEIEDPMPGVGEVLVRVGAAGVNPVDTYVRSGVYERLPQLPYIPGGDAAGTVEAVGVGVTRFAPGDRVYVAGASGGSLTGCTATRIVKREAELHPLPSRVSFEQGAALGVPYATAYRGLFHKGEAKAGETVLVHGATGGVGSAAVQLAVAGGMRVAGTGSTARGRDGVRSLGAELVLDHSRSDYLEEVRDWTDGRGVDVILEMAAHVNLDRDLEVAARGGRVVVVGCRGPVEVHPRKAMVKDLTIRAFALALADEAEMAAIHAALVAGLESGVLEPVVGEVVPFRDAERAHRLVESRGDLFGNVVLVPLVGKQETSS